MRQSTVVPCLLAASTWCVGYVGSFQVRPPLSTANQQSFCGSSLLVVRANDTPRRTAPAGSTPAWFNKATSAAAATPRRSPSLMRHHFAGRHYHDTTVVMAKTPHTVSQNHHHYHHLFTGSRRLSSVLQHSKALPEDETNNSNTNTNTNTNSDSSPSSSVPTIPTTIATGGGDCEVGASGTSDGEEPGGRTGTGLSDARLTSKLSRTLAANFPLLSADEIKKEIRRLLHPADKVHYLYLRV